MITTIILIYLISSIIPFTFFTLMERYNPEVHYRELAKAPHIDPNFIVYFCSFMPIINIIMSLQILYSLFNIIRIIIGNKK